MNAADAPNGPLIEFGPRGTYLSYMTESARPGAQSGGKRGVMRGDDFG